MRRSAGRSACSAIFHQPTTPSKRNISNRNKDNNVPKYSPHTKNNDLTKDKFILCSNCKYYVRYDSNQKCSYDGLRLSKDILISLKVTVIKDKDPTFNNFNCNDCITTNRLLSQNRALVEKYEKSQDELKKSRTQFNTLADQFLPCLNDISMLKTNLAESRDEIAKFHKERSATNEVSSTFLKTNKVVDKNNVSPFILNTDITPKDYETIDAFVQQKIVENSAEMNNEFREQNARRKRMVIIGVPKDSDDKQFVIELSAALNLGIDETKIKKTFRINAKNISADKSPPLNVEFHNESDKLKFLNQVSRDKIKSLPTTSKFYHVKFFPDRTYKQRKKLNDLKLEMAELNNQLIARNVTTDKWIIRNYALSKITVFGGRSYPV